MDRAEGVRLVAHGISHFTSAGGHRWGRGSGSLLHALHRPDASVRPDDALFGDETRWALGGAEGKRSTDHVASVEGPLRGSAGRQSARTPRGGRILSQQWRWALHGNPV